MMTDLQKRVVLALIVPGDDAVRADFVRLGDLLKGVGERRDLLMPVLWDMQLQGVVSCEPEGWTLTRVGLRLAALVRSEAEGRAEMERERAESIRIMREVAAGRGMG